MKQVYLFLTLALSLCLLGTANAQQSLPYSYGFEDGDLSTDGWTTQVTSSYSGIIEDGDYAYEGSHFFAFNYSENPGYIVSPLLTGTEGGVSLSFYYEEYSDEYGDEQFYVGYTTDESNSDPSTFTYGDIVIASTSWQLYQITLPAGTKRIAIQYVYTDAYYLFLDDFTFEAPGACPKPTALAVSGITVSSATLTWTAGGSEPSWKVYLNGSYVTTVNTNSYTFTGLSGNTSYTLGVVAVCGVGDESNMATKTAKTACGAVASFPYITDFEGGDSDIECWTLIDDDGDGNNWQIMTNADMHVHGGTAAITSESYINGVGAVTPDNWLVSPALTLPSDRDMQLSWWERGQDASWPDETYSVYVSTSGNTPADFNTSDPQPMYTATGEYVNQIINLAAYRGQTIYIAFRHFGCTDLFRLNIDDISVEDAPSCAVPTDISVNEWTYSTVSISWTDNNSGSSTYEILDDAENVVGTIDNLTTTGVTITGLTAETSYPLGSFKVRARCSSSETSDAANVPSFFTGYCQPAPGSIDGDGITAVSFGSGSNTVNNTNYPTSSPYYGDYHDMVGTVYAGATASIEITYVTGYAYRTIIWVDWDNDLNFEDGEQVYNDLSEATSPTTLTATFDIPAVQALGNYRMRIGGARTYFDSYEAPCYSGANFEAVFHDYTLNVAEIPNCMPPAGLTASDETPHGVTLEWNNGGSETAWQLYVSENNSAPASNIDESNVTNVTTHPFTIANGLDPETTYYAWVRANCTSSGNGYSDWVGPETFTTDIACPVPTAFAADHLTGHTADLTWTGTAESYTVKYRTAAYMTSDGLIEDFEGGTMPEGWTKEGSGTWSVGEGDYSTSTGAHGGDYNAKITHGNTGNETYLVTPNLDLSGKSGLNVNLWYINRAWSGDNDAFGIYYRVNGGEWNEIFATAEAHSTWTEVNEALPAGAYAANCQFGFKFTDAYGYGVGLDDIAIGTLTAVPAGAWQTANTATAPYQITGLDPETKYEAKVQGDCGSEGMSQETSSIFFTTDVACPAPTDLAAGIPGPTYVPLKWVENGTATDWQICINGDEMDLTEVNSSEVTIDGDTMFYQLTELVAGLNFSVKVRANCGGLDGTSAWSNTVDFITANACPTPVLDLAGITDITGHTANVSWTGFNENNSYVVSYRTKEYVDGLVEEFGTSVPTDWTKANTLLTDDVLNGTTALTLGSSSWSFGTNNGVFDNHARLNIYGSSCKSWLITPATTLGANPALSFDLALTYWSGTLGAPQTTGTDDRFVVLASNDDGTTWTILREWNNSGSPYVYNDIANTADGENVNINLSSYAGQSVKIAFYGESTTSNADNNLHIDNVAVGNDVPAGAWQTMNVSHPTTSALLSELDPETDYEVKVKGFCNGGAESNESDIVDFTTDVACPAPTALAYSNVTASSVDLSWTDNNASAWQVQVGSQTPIEVTENPYTLTGLTSASEYSVMVRAVCGGLDGNSEWSDQIIFSTACDAVTAFPWTENFNGLSVDASIPTCWNNDEGTTSVASSKWCHNTNTSGNGATSGTSHDGSNCVRFNSFSNANGNTNFLKSIPLSLPSSPAMQLSFWYKNPAGGDFSVYISTDGGTTHETALVTNLTGVADWTELDPISLSAYAGQEVVLVFKGTSNYANNDAYLYLDDVTVEESSLIVCEPAADVTVTPTTNTAVINWTNNNGLSATYTVKQGGTPLTSTAVNSYEITGLTDNTAYAAGTYTIVSNCDGTTSVDVPAFTTLCGAQSIPYTYDFETDDKLACWTPISGIIARFGGNSYSGSYRLNFRGSTDNMVALPTFNTPTNKLRLEFYTRPEVYYNLNCGNFAVGYMTDINDASTFVAIATYAYDDWTSDDYQEKVVDFTSAPADAIIAMRQFNCTDNFYWYVDDITVTEIPCLPAANVAVIPTSTNTAIISWTNNNGSSATFTVKKGVEVLTSIAVNSYEITGLTTATTYAAGTYTIVSNCDGTTSVDVPAFTTRCEAQEIPYTYDFETADKFTCWTPLSGKITRKTDYPNSGSYYLDFRGTTDNIVALPQFNVPTNTLRMEFYTRPENHSSFYCGNFAVGYMTEINDTSTFVAIETYAYNDWGSETYKKKTVDFIGAPANAIIALRHFNCANNWYWFVDDVTVIPRCKEPTVLTANNITSRSAVLGWTANSDETEWTVYYKKTTEGSYTEVPNVTTNPYTLTGLEAGTDYQFYVVANCSEYDNSEASEVSAFTTCSAIAALGYSENFDGYSVASSSNPTLHTLPPCWSYINGCTNNPYKLYPTIYSYNSTEHSTPNSVRFYSISASDPHPQYAILPEMTELAGKQITLQARGYNASSTFKIGTMSDPTDEGTFHTIFEQNGLTTDYQEFSYIIPATTDVYVAIMIDAATPSRTDNGVYIDDIAISEAPACLPAASVTVTPTANTAVISWTNNNGPSATYTVKQGGTTLTTTAVDSYEITGLTSHTTYAAGTYTIVSNCDGTTSVDVPEFTIECGIEAIPYTYGFETADEFACWTPISGTITRINGIPNSGSYRLDFRGTTDNMVALPTFNAPTNTLRVEFYTRPESYSYTNCGNFAVGYMTDINDASTFVAIATYAYNDWAASEYQKKTVDFIDAPADAIIAMRQFNCANNYYWYVDDVTVTESPSCLPAVNVAITPTANTAVISWTNNNGSSANYTVKDGETPLTTTAVNSYIIEGLTSNTTYAAGTYTIVSNCDGTTSVDVPAFTTECGIEAIPYTYDFETADKFRCWTPIAGVTILNSSSYAHNSTNSLMFAGNTSNMVALPTFNVPTNTLRLKFYTRPEVTDGNSGKFAVGYLTDINDASTFVSIATYNSTEMTDSYVKDSVDFTSAPADAIIALRQFDCSNIYYWYVDDITVTESPSCMHASNVTVAPTANTAVISWTNNNGSSATYTVKQGENVLTPTAVNSYTIEGLTSNTAYAAGTYTIVSNCDGTTSVDVPAFTTECGIEAIPYTYDFETADKFKCWTPIAGAEILNLSAYAHNSTYSLKFAGTTDNMVALPTFNAPTNTLRVEFYTRPEISHVRSGKFAVGYMTDINDASTFVAIETYNGTELTTDYVKKTVDFTSAPANAIIALRQFDCYTSYYWLVDDITVKVIPSCEVPTALTATNITSGSAVLGWTANNGETDWTVYYKQTSEGSYTEITGVTDTSYTLTGLDAFSSYLFYVVANCSPSDNSEASEVYAFTTSCEPITITTIENYTQGFEEYTGVAYSSTDGVIPDCWENPYSIGTNTTITPHVIGDDSYYYYGHAGSKALTFYGKGSNYVTLPKFTNALNELSVSFWMQQENASRGTLILGYITSEDVNYNTFQEIESYNGVSTMTQFTKYLNTLPAEAARLVFRWQQDGSPNYSCCIDDVEVELLSSCLPPTALTAGIPGPHSVTLTWTANSGETEWVLSLNEDPSYSEPAEGDPDVTVEGTTVSHTVTGLNPNTTYTFTISGHCPGSYSDPSNEVTITTADACPIPIFADDSISNITGHTADVAWGGFSENTDGYIVSYRTQAYVNGIYEEFGTTPSGWEKKTGLLSEVMGGTALTNSGNWYFETRNGVFNNHARINIWGAGVKYWLITPAINVEDGFALNFDLALTAYNGTLEAPETDGADDRFIVLVTTDDENTWAILREWNNSGSEYVYNDIAHTTTGENVNIDLSSYAGQSVRIAFYGESTVANADNNLHIDNVLCGMPVTAGAWQNVETTSTSATLTGLTAHTDYEVRVKGLCDENEESAWSDTVVFTTGTACPDPTALTASAITTNSATLSWTENGTATAWVIGCTVGSETSFIEATTNPFTLTGLTPATKYTVQVRANCNEEGTSFWSNVVVFTTACEDIASFPWTEDFEGFNDNTIPVCWDNSASTSPTIEGSNPEFIWGVYYHGSPSNKMLWMYNNMVQSGTALINSPIIALPSEGAYKLTFDYANHATCGDFTVKISTDNGTSFTDLQSFASDNSGERFDPGSFTEAEISLAAYAGESVILQFYAVADYDNGAIFVDNVAISEVPVPCDMPTNLAIDHAAPRSAEISWTNGGDETAWQLYYSTTGTAPAHDIDESLVTNANSNPFVLDGVLTPETEYFIWVRAICGGSDNHSGWSGPATFSTTEPCRTPVLETEGITAITAHTADVAWTGYGECSNYIVNYRTKAYVEGLEEHFNTSEHPEGWTFYRGLVDTIVTGTELVTIPSNWGWQTSTHGLGTYNLALNIYGRNDYWAITPEINLLPGSVCNFDLALTAYDGDGAAFGTCIDDRFVVLVYANDQWTILREWNNSGSEYIYNDIATAGENVSIDITSYIGQTVKFAFYGESTVPSNGDNDMHIDNLILGHPVAAGDWQTLNANTAEATITGLVPETEYEVRVMGDCGSDGTSGSSDTVTFTTTIPCVAPTALTAGVPGATSVDLSWTENGTATVWQLCMNGGEEYPITITENPYTFSGLAPHSTYRMKVRANCGGEDGVSDWSNEVTFTTACGTITSFPWAEDFETSAVNYPLNLYCWVNEHIAGDGSYVFNVYGDPTGTNSTHQLKLPDMAIGTMTKLMLPEMSIPTDNYYFFMDIYRSDYIYNELNYQYEGIRVYTSDDGEIEGATELAFIPRQYEVSNAVIPAEEEPGWYTYKLPLGHSGNTYIILRGENQYNTNIFIDNFVVQECNIPITTETRAICDAELPYTWNGVTFDEAGTQDAVLTAANGCDSVVTMTVIVNTPVHNATTVTACETYTWTDGNGETYTESGNYLHSHADANGCTQVDTLHLTINKPVHTAITVVECETYTWTDGNGTTYTESGTYTHSHTDANGCTQVDTLHLTINNPVHTATTVTACETYT
ncbi:MAG: choice-of-anchor J domain-containing protein, partial [Bacteroidales bacterium]|nr:choice-of-anchor J domain-containing protein [Bacteroidales bacterium]